MKRYGKLWNKLISWENLVLAARKAQRRKRDRREVQRFNFFQEMRLLRLQAELTEGRYQPGGFRSHWITRPKPRLISAAPYRDRVVHHALMNILEPILERHFHPDSYACRKNKGTLSAANRLQKFMQKYRYAVHCDIQKFFPNIDHEIMKSYFRRLIKDKRILALMDLIVDTANDQPGDIAWFDGDDLFTPTERRLGLPIGNLTSQWFANWYLSDLDHYVTSHLGIGGYVRYCDDFILLHNDRQKLKEAVALVRERLIQSRLKIHEQRAFVQPVRAGLTFIGFRFWPTHRLVRKSNIKDFRRRVRWLREQYALGEISWDYVQPRLASWIGHAQQAYSHKLILRLSREWKFSRDGTDMPAGDSRRRVEQQCHELPGRGAQQQHAVQSEQQQRISISPALSDPQARNCTVHGLCERGYESPGSVPASSGAKQTGGQMYRRETGGSGRSFSEGPARIPAKYANDRQCHARLDRASRIRL